VTTEKSKKGFNSIDEYIMTFSKAVQEKLQGMRKTIRAAAPDAEERISYQIPTFYLRGNLVHFAAFKKHIGFYPTSSGVRNFKKKCRFIKLPKARCDFLWTNHCRWR